MKCLLKCLALFSICLLLVVHASNDQDDRRGRGDEAASPKRVIELETPLPLEQQHPLLPSTPEAPLVPPEELRRFGRSIVGIIAFTGLLMAYNGLVNEGLPLRFPGLLHPVSILDVLCLFLVLSLSMLTAVWFDAWQGSE